MTLCVMLFLSTFRQEKKRRDRIRHKQEKERREGLNLQEELKFYKDIKHIEDRRRRRSNERRKEKSLSEDGNSKDNEMDHEEVEGGGAGGAKNDMECDLIPEGRKYENAEQDDLFDAYAEAIELDVV